MTDRSFHPKLVRTQLYDSVHVATYVLCDRGATPVAALTVPVPTIDLEALEAWEGLLHAHIVCCWQLVFGSTETAMLLLCVSLDQVPELPQNRKPILTHVDFIKTHPGAERTLLNPPVPHMFLPDFDW